MKRVFRWIGLVALCGVLGFGAFLVMRIGPRNVIGMLRYDQRHEGRLRVGDPAPDVVLTALDGTPKRLLGESGDRPVVLVFGSYT
jgi:hypothetical protein